VQVPVGTALTNVAPESVSVSPFATLVPDASTPRNFTAPVTYIVRAQDLSEKAYTVTVTAVDPNDLFTTYEAEQAEYTGKTDNQHAGYTGTGFVDFLAGGENYILFTVCQQQAGSRLLKFRYALGKAEERTAQLYVNDVAISPLAFPPTATFTDWAFATASVSLPAGVSRIKLAWPATDGPNIDHLAVNGAPCNTYLVQPSATGGGSVVLSPQRAGNAYFEGETVTASAIGATGILFVQWSGDTSATANPLVFEVRKVRQLVAQFSSVPVYTLTVQVNGVGKVVINPTGNSFAAGTMVALQAQTLIGSSFLGWSGDASGTNPSTTVTMDANKTVTASFNSTFNPDFTRAVGFAAVAGDGFAGPTIGGAAGSDTLIINGPAEFNKLCEAMYYRGRTYKNNVTTGGYKKAPLTVMLKSGVYDGTQALSADGAKAFANAMLDIPEQGDITFMGDCSVVFKIGINVKRSWNVLIRNISFYDYDDDAINVGYPETHHVWIDHCTFGHPQALPASKDVPDGTSETKDGASFVTISWCKYQNHWKTSLVGHSDNNGATDAGRLKVTYYANYFVNTNSRNPRVRFGQVHVLNNLYENSGLGRQGQLGYGIAASNNSQVYAEGNFFIDTRWPILADRATAPWTAVYGNGLESPTGNWPCYGLVSVNNEYDDAGLTQSLVGKVKAEMLNPGGMSIRFDTLTTPQFTFNPANNYNYEAALLPASAVRVLIPLFAGADVLGGGGCVLPVSLISFTGTTSGAANRLDWTTTGEQNLAAYELQRSADGKNFVRIATLVPANNTVKQHYTWLDKRPPAGVNFYRLAMANNDGSRKYSHVVKLQHLAGGSLAITGGASLRNLRIQVPAGAAKPGELVIYSADGKIIGRVPVSPANRNVPLNMDGKPAGKYWVLWQQGETRLLGSFAIW